MSGFSSEAKVGLLVVISLAVLAYFTIHLGVLKLGGGGGYPLHVTVDSASGLKRKAPVLMAGIQIGTVDAIELVENRARLTLLIRPEVALPQDSAVTLSTQGILGDTYVKIMPGQGQALAEGENISRVQASARLEDLGDLMGSVLADLKEITSSLKISLASADSQRNIQDSLANIREITDSLKIVIAGNEQRLVNVVQNLEKFTGDLSELTGDNKRALSDTIKNLRQVSVDLGQVMHKINQGEGTVGALVNERQTVDDLNATLASLNSISRKVDEGQGSLGKLVNDGQTIENLDGALSGINDYITRADKWRLGIDYRGEWNMREQAMRNTLNVRLQPTADKFFLLGVVDDPRGQREDSSTYSQTTVNGHTTVTEDYRRHIEDDKLGFNAQFGKRFYDFTLRGGLFNSSGGVALDYHLLRDNLLISFEASEFRRDEQPRLRIAAEYKFWKYFYLTAGYDDFISQYDQDNFFFGAGVTFYDDDLKYLFSSTSMP